MKIQKQTTQEIEVTTISLSAGVRYWEDATINGISDEEGTLTPFANGDMWEPKIDIAKGIILNWPQGTIAGIHFKVCDQCSYRLLDDNGVIQYSVEDEYVPKLLCPKDAGYGDYIIMDIDADGKIADWDVSELDSLIREG